MWGRRTRRDAIISERQLLRIRVIDAVHPLFGQPLEVSPSGLIRRIGWVRMVLPDGRHRWVPQKATDLNVSACEAKPNRDLPLVSVRTLIPLAEYVRARLSALGEKFDETSGHTADPAVRAGIAGSTADLGDARQAGGAAGARRREPAYQICFALDAGARGIVVPMVNTSAEAEG